MCLDGVGFSVKRWKTIIFHHFFLFACQLRLEAQLNKHSNISSLLSKGELVNCAAFACKQSSLVVSRLQVTHFISDKRHTTLRPCKLSGTEQKTDLWSLAHFFFFFFVACSFNVNTLTLHKLITSEADGFHSKGVVFLHTPVKRV